MTTPAPGNAYLEEFGEFLGANRKHPLKTLCSRVGRSSGADIVLASPQISSFHAEIFRRDSEIWLRDLASTNGTFLNGRRVIEPVPLSDGDVVHFAEIECVLHRKTREPTVQGTIIIPKVERRALTSHGKDASALRELLKQKQVTAMFQPILGLNSLTQTRFELLGRGAHPRLPASPRPLFEICERHGLSTELSQLFRSEGIDVAAKLPGRPEIFVNTHPQEPISEVVRSLRLCREKHPRVGVTLELHESSVTNPKAMTELRAELRDLEMGLAYDDFGSGQARLLELVEVPPDYLKFDIALIRDLDSAPPPRRRLLKTLVSMVLDLGITCLAEGIETTGEFDACIEMGFSLGQGYLLGRPALISEWQPAGQI